MSSLVGILSDTHGHLPASAFASLAECDFLIHAGDICSPEILGELETLAPVAAVLGNNDFDEYGSAVGRFARPVVEGVRFLVAHYPQDVRISFAGSAGVAPGDPLPHVLVHGHTHIAHITTGPEVRPAELCLCPGSTTRPRGGFPRTVAKLRVGEGRVLGARIVAFEENPEKTLLEWPAR